MMMDRACAIGGGGFVGGHIANRLTEHGIRIPARRRERVKGLPALPTVDVLEAGVRDDATLDRLWRRSGG